MSGGAFAALEPVLDGGSVDVLHDEVRRSFVLAERVHGEDVRMRDARHRAGLDGEELAQVLVLEELGADELDGDVAVEAIVVRQRHDAHAARAERTDDAIGVGDHGAALEAQVAHDRDVGARIGLDRDRREGRRVLEARRCWSALGSSRCVASCMPDTRSPRTLPSSRAGSAACTSAVSFGAATMRTISSPMLLEAIERRVRRPPP